MSRCWCGALYADADDCPRCAIDADRLGEIIGEMVDEHVLPFPLPDGPDDMLSHIAELEAQVEREQRVLGDTSGARTCYYCRELIPPGVEGTSAGVHEACLPEILPEGARSCAGCAELILNDDDEFEHDFCPTPADEAETEPDVSERLGFSELLGIDFSTVHPLLPSPSSDLFSSRFSRGDIEADGIEAGDIEAGDLEAELPPSADRVLRHSDAVLCSCQRWVEVSLTAPPHAWQKGIISAASVKCSCGLDLTVAYSWRQGRFVAVKVGEQTLTLN